MTFFLWNVLKMWHNSSYNLIESVMTLKSSGYSFTLFLAKALTYLIAVWERDDSLAALCKRLRYDVLQEYHKLIKWHSWPLIIRRLGTTTLMSTGRGYCGGSDITNRFVDRCIWCLYLSLIANKRYPQPFCHCLAYQERYENQFEGEQVYQKYSTSI